MTEATSMAFGNGRYVMPGIGGKVWTSPDTTHWNTNYSGFRGTIYQILRGASNYVLVAADQPILLSSDGNQFVPASGSPVGSIGRVTFDGTNYVGLAGADIYTSTDATNWVLRTSNSSQQLNGVCHGPTRWVAVGGGGTVVTSPNSLAWTLRASGTANHLSAVAFGNNIYVAVGIKRHDHNLARWNSLGRTILGYLGKISSGSLPQQPVHRHRRKRHDSYLPGWD